MSKIEFCCYRWTGVAKFSLFSLDRIQNLLRSLEGDEIFPTQQLLSHRQNYHYSIAISMVTGHFLVLLVLNFTVKSRTLRQHVGRPSFPLYSIDEMKILHTKHHFLEPIA